MYKKIKNHNKHERNGPKARTDEGSIEKAKYKVNVRIKDSSAYNDIRNQYEAESRKLVDAGSDYHSIERGSNLFKKNEPKLSLQGLRHLSNEPPSKNQSKRQIYDNDRQS